MKKLMIGNEAVARGAFEAGVNVVSSYPGTPSTEITEFLAKFDGIHVEWAPNEKVAAEVSTGASIAGGRTLCAMKHVGLNVAADPLFTISYTGVNGGFVLCVADDPGMHSSQNEQDSRHHARASKSLMLEPSDSGECLEFTKRAFALSEEFDTPVLLRLSTRVSHSQSLVDISDRQDVPVKPFEKRPEKYVMMPGYARARHVVVEDRILKLKEFAETTDLNKVEYFDKKIGIITSGICYEYAKEALGENASYLKLGMVYPLCDKKLKEFVNSVETCYVLEELDPYIEEHCKALGLSVIGKEKFSLLGEYGADIIKKVILGEKVEFVPVPEPIPPRPPVMCAGCPHRGLFYVLSQLKLVVSGDIGCYTLAAQPPLKAMDTTICMGASIPMAHGMEKANPELRKRTVSVIGDSTFLHSGMTGLLNSVYNQANTTTIILDNSITGMTGHQQNPATGLTIRNEPTKQADLEAICRGLGVERVRIVDPNEIEEVKKIVKEELEAEEPSVIITKRPCALLKYVKFGNKLKIKHDDCKKCGACLKIGCPAISKDFDNTSVIDSHVCVGCGLCLKVCRFSAISERGEN